VQKRLIEWDLPLAEISEESAREKNIRSSHPHMDRGLSGGKPSVGNTSYACSKYVASSARNNLPWLGYLR
jgi:hypothetical protein